jgi:hypothetical protein
MSNQPGDRVAAEAPPAATADEPEFATLTGRRALHAFDWGALAALGVAFAYGVLWGVIQLQWGLIAAAVMGGWVVGAGVRHGAWKGALHPRAIRVQLLGGALGLGSWLGGSFVAYLLSRVVLPSDLDLGGRLAALPFADYLSLEYEAAPIVHAAALVALAIMGWRTAR